MHAGCNVNYEHCWHTDQQLQQRGRRCHNAQERRAAVRSSPGEADEVRAHSACRAACAGTTTGCLSTDAGTAVLSNSTRRALVQGGRHVPTPMGATPLRTAARSGDTRQATTTARPRTPAALSTTFDALAPLQRAAGQRLASVVTATQHLHASNRYSGSGPPFQPCGAPCFSPSPCPGISQTDRVQASIVAGDRVHGLIRHTLAGQQRCHGDHQQQQRGRARRCGAMCQLPRAVTLVDDARTLDSRALLTLLQWYRSLAVCTHTPAKRRPATHRTQNHSSIQAALPPLLRQMRQPLRAAPCRGC